MLQLGPPKCTFGSGRDSEPRICAPVMLGKYFLYVHHKNRNDQYKAEKENCKYF